MADEILTPCNVARGTGIRTLNSPGGSTLHVTRKSGITTLNSPGGSTPKCDKWLWDDMHWIRPKVRHIGILHLVLILTISPKSTCHSAPVCEILSKSNHPSCRLSRWQKSAILDFRGSIMGSLKSPCTTIDTIALKCLLFEKIVFFCISATHRQTDK